MKQFFLHICDIFFLCRPVLLIPVWSVLVLGLVTGSDIVFFQPLSTIPWQFFALSAAFTLSVISIFVLNQITDIETDKNNNKLFLLPRNYISQATAWTLVVCSAAAALVIPVFFLDRFSVCIIGASLILGYLYNMPPFSLKDHPLGGVAANFLGHGVLTYLAGWYGAQFLEPNVQILSGVFYSLAAGFANAAVYTASTIADAEGDRICGKRTFAVAFGAKNAVVFSALLVTFSLVFSFFLPHNSWVMVLTSAVSVILFWRSVFAYDSTRAFVLFRWPVLFLSLLLSVYIPLYALVVFIVVFLSRVYYQRRFSLCYPAFGQE
jgi:4-hydroxybenzoate polyprenyltransferase